jgi:thiol-disulfide isomerase/thioredoxin
MKAKWLFVLVLLLGTLLWQPCRAEVDLEILRNFAVDAAPLDVAVSADGRWIYVLTGDARLHIYSPAGELKGTVAVPPGSQRVATGPGDDVLFVANSENRTVQTVRVNLQHEFTSAQSPTRGPADAPVTLTLFTDFECSYCARLAPVLEEVHQAFPEKVRIVFKNFPLRMHRFAVQAALAALAAEDQGQFWPFHDRLFRNYNQLNDQKVEEIRQELNLDAERFKSQDAGPGAPGPGPQGSAGGQRRRSGRHPNRFYQRQNLPGGPFAGRFQQGDRCAARESGPSELIC